jgi:hypothetical protein
MIANKQVPAHKNRGTLENKVFYGGPCRGFLRRATGGRIRSWKGAVIQRGLESGSRGIAIVGAVNRKRLVESVTD